MSEDETKRTPRIVLNRLVEHVSTISKCPKPFMDARGCPYVSNPIGCEECVKRYLLNGDHREEAR